MISFTHPADGALIAFLDEPDANQPIAEHLADCAECQSRLEAVERRSANLSDLFARADAMARADATARPAAGGPMPRPASQRPARRRQLAVAAAVGALATATWFSPLRARITEWFASPAPAVEAAAGGESESRIEFPIDGRALRIRVTADDAGSLVRGTLTVNRTDSPTASVQIGTADGTETIRLDGRELAVDVGRNPAPAIRITLPGGVDDVEIWVGRAGPFTPEWTTPTAGETPSWSVDLGTLR